uniref:F-box domain-containing protein n=1 Tax=Lactuca sativa TaxID=4236 RepID=A0A9R1XXJ7_LACSA|nr:hypothetical protein LSAT_V11C100004190 [Lactuca sativa]
MKLKFVLNSKKQWEVKQQTRNWLDLPQDVMANILYRVGVYDILENAQKEMCKHAVDRSQGQLVDITICDFVNEELLGYIANRSSQLKRLEFVGGDICKNWVAFLKKIPLLEELRSRLIVAVWESVVWESFLS